MKLIYGGLLLLVASTVNAECYVNNYGKLVNKDGISSCPNSNSSYRQSGSSSYMNMYGSTPDNKNKSYNSFDGGNTWRPTSPSSSQSNSLGVNVEIDVNKPNQYVPNPYPNPYSNQNNRR